MKNLIKLSMLLILGTSFLLSECVSGDCVNGYGKYIFSNGEEYNGNWKYDMRNGHGENIWSDGATYLGEWKHDKPVE